MNQNDNAFIDAYGLELNDELNATYAEPIDRPSSAISQPTPIDESPQRERSYRFDAARSRTLRGPHFDMRHVTSRSDTAISNADSLDMNVIDVGAAWLPSPSVVHPSAEESTDTPQAARVEDSIEEDVATQEEIVNTAEDSAREQAAPEVLHIEATATSVEAIETTSPVEVSVPEPAAIAATHAIREVPARFAPVWEVDRFNWPKEIDDLFEAQSEYFDYAGNKLIAASREGLKTLAITSTRPQEGSTTLALCLARAAARAGARVALLDGNLNQSELGDKLGVDFASGWQTVATGEQPLAEAAITGLEEGITLFPSAAKPVGDLDSLGDARVREVLRSAASNYDLLIIDAGQANFGDNVEVLDAAMVVRDIRITSEQETLTVANALRDCGVKAVGIAENFGGSEAKRIAA
jgi:Mrp family chromosome partitioning ATPase